jgi:hypothetical protein
MDDDVVVDDLVEAAATDEVPAATDQVAALSDAVASLTDRVEYLIGLIESAQMSARYEAAAARIRS